MDSLCDRDKAVLRSILDPTATVGDVVDDGDHFEEEDQEPTSEEDHKSRDLCTRGVQLAEVGQMQEALELLTKAIEVAPRRAAAYNDRAQLYRLMLKDNEAMRDIERCVQLTAGTRCRARAQALCQRGVLLRKEGGREDDARAAFHEAALLGSGFAKKQTVELNPYAALCNQMLSQIMNGEKEVKL